MKKLGVIIPRYAHEVRIDKITDEAIRQVLKVAELDTHIYVIDNGSTIQFSNQSDKVRYTRWDINRGVAPAWNEGWRQATNADFLCWLNADVIVEVGWDKALCIAAEQLDCVAMPFTNGEKSDGVGITGWCFLTRRDIAARIGAFDESFAPAYYEDTDWFHRAIQENIPLVNVPMANVMHTRMKGGTETAPWFKNRNLLHMANRYRYAWKHDVSVESPPAFWRHPLPDVEFDSV